MIAFATIFLGLVLGIQPVTVVVGEEVARVELVLNGRPVATLAETPWTAECDFGTELLPQTLEAIAYNGEGEEMDRARQRINLPGGLAEARIVIEDSADGAATYALVVFDSVQRMNPERTTVSLDGRPLEVSDLRRFELPPYDPDQIHHLSVELEFPNNITTLAEITFGGEFSDHIGTPQTAVPVVAERGRLPRTPNDLRHAFSRDGQPLRVLAIDEGPAEVVIVRDRSAQRELDRLAVDLREKLFQRGRSAARAMSRFAGGGGLTGALTGSLRFAAPLKKDQLVWLLEPFAKSRGDGPYPLEAFDSTPHMTPRDGGLPFLLTAIRPPTETDSRQRLADAVAVAGRGVAQRDRRRAVVLILGEGSDASALSAEIVRRYLRTVHVPLVVWSAEEPTTEAQARWGVIRDISNVARLEREIKALAELVDRQRIVWLEGFHLPQQISLADRKGHIEFPM